MREPYYYVQPLTAQVFVVRRCMSASGEPGPDDAIVRSFEVHHDASSYARSLNESQSPHDSMERMKDQTSAEQDKPRET